MIHSLQPPSPTDRQLVGETMQCSQKLLETIRPALGLEEKKNSYMARTLLQAEIIARYRIMACLSVGATWRKLPEELWDKIFVFYLDETRVQARRDVGRPRPASTSYLTAYLQSMGGLPSGGAGPPPERSGERVDRRVMNAPLPLLGVCRAWRAAALSTPSLWSNVVISSVATETAVGTVPFIAASDAARLMPRLKGIVINPIPGLSQL
jgi:hypothetical protein